MGAPIGNKNAEGKHSPKVGDLDHPQTRFAWGWNDARANDKQDPMWHGKESQHPDKMYVRGYRSGQYEGHDSAAEAYGARARQGEAPWMVDARRSSGKLKSAARAAVLRGDK